MQTIGSPPGNENPIDRVLREIREQMTADVLRRLHLIVWAFVVARAVVR